MDQQHTVSPVMVVRALEREDEINTLITLMIQEFNAGADLTTTLPRRRQFFLQAPYFDPSQLRGAFLNDTYVGGYVIEERTLHIGAARLLTGCIGGVVTRAEHRMKGVGAALLRDAVAYGHARHHALLLLDGIHDFYHRFGFIDVLDLTRHAIERAHVLALPPSPYRVRPATFEDCPALLAMYQRHYAHYAGSFARTLEHQQHLYRFRHRMPALLALRPDDTPCGYLQLLSPWGGLYAYEVAADDWPATQALLHYHAQQLVELGSQESEFWWPLPPDAPTLYALTDHLAVRSQVVQRPDADWMARVAHVPTLLHALLPLWQERWQGSTRPWSGTLALAIDDTACLLALDEGGPRIVEQPVGEVLRASLSQQALVQLLFSYRPVSWLRQQPGQSVPDELVPVLDALFPYHRAWIAGSDSF